MIMRQDVMFSAGHSSSCHFGAFEIIVAALMVQLSKFGGVQCSLCGIDKLLSNYFCF